jgi:hypothetical protein
MTAFVPLSSFFCFCGVAGFKELMNDPSIIYGSLGIVTVSGCMCFTIQLWLIQKINIEFLYQIYEKLKNEEEYKFMLDKLEHSIIIIQDD